MFFAVREGYPLVGAFLYSGYRFPTEKTVTTEITRTFAGAICDRPRANAVRPYRVCAEIEDIYQTCRDRQELR